MHNSLLTEDTYKRADLIYKSIAEEYNPHLREFVTCSKAHEKNFADAGRSYKSCYDAAQKIGIAATSSPGCKDVGKCIMHVAETLQEVNMIREDWLQKFREGIIYPVEKRLEQDSKYVVGLRKKSQEEFKSRSAESEKSFQNLSKLKKKMAGKPSTKKGDDKIQKATERLIAAKASSEMVAHEMLSRAFSEERRRYCFFLEKQCEMINAWMRYHRESFDMLQANLQEWEAVGASYRDLLPGAVALIESSLPRRTNVTLDDLEIEAQTATTHSSEDLSTMYEGPTVNVNAGSTTEIKINIERSPTRRAVGSKRDVDGNYSANEAESVPDEIGDGDETQDENTGKETDGESLSVTQESNLSSTRSSASSIHLNSLFRNSVNSSLSIYSQESHLSAETSGTYTYPTENNRASMNDSGISVSEVWASESDEYDTIKRSTRHKSPTKEVQIKDEINDVDGQSTKEREKNDGNDENIIKDSCKLKTEEQPVKSVKEVHYEVLHAFIPPPGASAKLTIQRGDRILALVQEEKGGWMYGENKRSMERGWFPVSYTSCDKAKLTPERSSDIEQNTQGTQPAVAVVPQAPMINVSLADVVAQHSALKQSEIRPKKPHAGHNVFKFAQDMTNPFEEIKLRKTTTASLN